MDYTNIICIFLDSSSYRYLGHEMLGRLSDDFGMVFGMMFELGCFQGDVEWLLGCILLVENIVARGPGAAVEIDNPIFEP